MFICNLIALFALASVAQAHASVSPRSVNASNYEKFVLRVPNEKESATVEVRVEIPEGFEISRVRPLYGWEYQIDKSTDGKLAKAITWNGSQILAGEFQEFEFQGKTAPEPGKYAFRAFQTYDDGERVEWTGPSGANKPAAFVEVKAAAGTTDAHGAEKPTQEAPGAVTGQPSPSLPAPAAPAAGTSPATSAAAYGGLLLGALALVVAIRKR